jgi:hypothetical protein
MGCVAWSRWWRWWGGGRHRRSTNTGGVGGNYGGGGGAGGYAGSGQAAGGAGAQGIIVITYTPSAGGALTVNAALAIDWRATQQQNTATLVDWRATRLANAALLLSWLALQRGDTSLIIEEIASERIDASAVTEFKGGIAITHNDGMPIEFLGTAAITHNDGLLIDFVTLLTSGWPALLQWASFTLPPPAAQSVVRRALKAAGAQAGRTIYRRMFLGVPATAIQANQRVVVEWLSQVKSSEAITITAQPIITINPSSPQIADTTPKGSVVATYTITMSDGSPFTGTIGFGPPNFDNGGVFALVVITLSTGQIIVNPNGPGVGPNPITITDHITLVATAQNFPLTLIEILSAQRQDVGLPVEEIARQGNNIAGQFSGQFEWVAAARADAGAPFSALATQTSMMAAPITAQPIININPTTPQLPDTSPRGTVVATYTITMSDSSPFVGTVTFGPPNFDGGGVFALVATTSSTGNIIVSLTGPGVGPNMTTITDLITLVATSNDPGGSLIEWVASLANNGALVVESLPTRRSDTLSFTEWTGGIGVFHSDGLPVELTAALRLDGLAVKEFIATQQRNAPISIEVSSVQRRDMPALGETLATDRQDIALYGEAVASENAVAAVSVEGSPTQRQDASPLSEIIATTLQSVGAPDEFYVGERQDTQWPIETAAGLQQNTSTSLPLESLATERIDAPTQAELFSAELSDTSVLSETTSMQKREDAPLPMESTSLELVNTPAASEFSSVIQRDGLGINTETLSAQRVDISAPADTSSALLTNAPAMQETITNARVDVSAPEEAIASARIDVPGAQETIANVRIDATAAQEAITSARIDAFVLADILSGGRIDRVCFLDFTSAQRVDAPPSNIEWFAAFRINGTLPIELIAIIRTDQRDLAEWILSTGTHLTTDAAALIEWLATPGFRLGLDSGLVIEWQGAPVPGPGQVIVASLPNVLATPAFQATQAPSDIKPKSG